MLYEVITGMNFILIPIIGTYGAAISSGIAFLLMTIMLYSKINYKEKKIFQELSFFLVFVISALLSYPLNHSITVISVLLKSSIIITIAIIFYKIHISKFFYIRANYK